MSDNGPSGSQLSRWVTSLATVIAPASMLSALLFYFGYVSSRSQYEYFGLDVDAIGLGTRDYVMRSPQALLVPLLVLTLLGAGLLRLHSGIRQRITAAMDRDGTLDSEARPATRIATMARAVMITGQAVLGVGIVLLFGYALIRGWAFYNLVTPLLITIGAGLIAYTSRVFDLLRVPAPRAPADSSVLARRAAVGLLYVLIVAGVFWATATVAQWSGRGLAQDQARNLDRLPRVILDTKERLFLRDPVVQETMLPASEGQTFRYRYRRLRLLIVGQNRMFLVPEKWSASDSTLVVPVDGSVRVQFQFQNQTP
jgi:hypothetical protein